MIGGSGRSTTLDYSSDSGVRYRMGDEQGPAGFTANSHQASGSPPPSFVAEWFTAAAAATTDSQASHPPHPPHRRTDRTRRPQAVAVAIAVGRPSPSPAPSPSAAP